MSSKNVTYQFGYLVCSVALAVTFNLAQLFVAQNDLQFKLFVLVNHEHEQNREKLDKRNN